MKIEKIDVFVIGPEDIHYTWSHDIPPIFQSNTIVRIYTDSNVIGEADIPKILEVAEAFSNWVLKGDKPDASTNDLPF